MNTPVYYPIVSFNRDGSKYLAWSDYLAALPAIFGEQTKAPPPPPPDKSPPDTTPPPPFLKGRTQAPLKYEGGGQKPPSFSDG